jgi:hypothetical protein
MVADAAEHEGTGEERDKQQIAPRRPDEPIGRNAQGQLRPTIAVPALVNPSGPGPQEDSARTRK